MGFSISSDPLRHITMGPPPQTKPSIQDISQLWGMASPEADAQRALMQYKLSSEQAGDQYAGNFGGAPTMDAAHLALSHEQHMDMLPWKMMQTQALSDRDRDRQAADTFAQQHGAPTYDAYKYQTSEQEHQAALQALNEQRQQQNQDRSRAHTEHLAGLVGQNPMLFAPQQAGHPQPPGWDMQRQLLMQANPELSQLAPQQNSHGLSPQQLAMLKNLSQ